MRAPVVIGGGPAGAAAALALRKAGQPVTLIERSTGPTDKVCGDFLGASATRVSERLGLPLEAIGALPVTHLRLIRRGTVTDSPLPFRALALSRRRFDEALLEACVAAGVDVLRGETVRPPRADSEDFVIRTAARGDISTGTLFLATGRPDASATARPSPRVSPRMSPWSSAGPSPGQFPRGTPQGLLTGYKMYLELRAAQRDELTGRVELMMLPHGQAALQRVEDDHVALCLLLRRHEPEMSWNRLLEEVLAQCPHLARRLAGAAPLLARPVIARSIPFGFLHRGHAMDHDGFYRIGDQAAVPFSLVADGVSVAIRSAMRATQSWLTGAGAGDYHRRLREMLWPRMRMVAHYDLKPNRGPPPMRGMAQTTDWFGPGLEQESPNATVSGAPDSGAPHPGGPGFGTPNSGHPGMSLGASGRTRSDPARSDRGSGPNGSGRDVPSRGVSPDSGPPDLGPSDPGPPDAAPADAAPADAAPADAAPIDAASIDAASPGKPPVEPPRGVKTPGSASPGSAGSSGPASPVTGGSAAADPREPPPNTPLTTRWDRLTA